MKKALALILALSMVFALCACGQSAAPAAALAACASTSAAPAAAPAAEAAPAEAAPAEAAAEPIRIAVVGPMTGADAMYGLGFRISAEIMAEKWNAEGGCLGRPVEIVVFDDKGSPEEAANVAEQIVADKSIVAVVGHFTSSCSMAASPVYQDHGMLEISPCSSHADYTKTGDWIWRVSPLTSDEAMTVSKYVANYLKSEKVGILTMNTDWGIEVADLEKEYISAINPNVVFTEEVVSEGNDDYSSVVTNFQAAGVETVICAATYTLSAPFAKQMRTATPDINLIAHGNCQVSQLTDILGEQGDNFSCSCAWSPIFTDEGTKYYVEKYAEKDDATPIGDYAQYYDTVGVLLQAITNVGSTDREAIRAELATIEYDGLSGHLNFDENRDCPRDYGIVYWDTADSAWHQNTEWNK